MTMLAKESAQCSTSTAMRPPTPWISPRRARPLLAGACAAAWFLLSSAAFSAPEQAAEASASEAERPNIVFVFADDLGWADVGYRDPDGFYETPNIDRFARRNLDFTDAYASAPLCTPTRAALMTGKYPSRLGLDRAIAYRHGQEFEPQDPRPAQESRPSLPFRKVNLYQNRNYLPLDEVTFAEALRDAGYATALLGKWHLGAGKYRPEHHGFETVFGGHPGGNPGSYFYPYPFTDAGQEGEYLTDRMALEAERFLENHRDEPFCLVLSHFAVHTPIQAKEDKIAHFRDKAERLGIENKNPTYAAMIASLDEAFGRVLDKIDALDLGDETLVVFTSDNGGMLYRGWQMIPNTSNAPLSGGKAMIGEGGIRVPLIVRWPGEGAKTGSEATPVSTVDFYPTFLDLAGVSLPANQDLDGMSLLPLLRKGGELPKRDIVFHWPYYLGNQITREASRRGEYANLPNTTIRSGPYKYTYHYTGAPGELYNVERDPGETRNLADERPELARSLEKRALGWAENAIPNYLPKKNEAYVEGYGLPIRDMTATWAPFRCDIRLDDHHLIVRGDREGAYIESFNTDLVTEAPVHFTFRAKSDSGLRGRFEWIDGNGNTVKSTAFEFPAREAYAETRLTFDLGKRARFAEEFRIRVESPETFDLAIEELRVSRPDGERIARYDFGIMDTRNWQR